MQFLRLLGFQDSTGHLLKIVIADIFASMLSLNTLAQENVIEHKALLESAQIIIARHIVRQTNVKPPNLRKEQVLYHIAYCIISLRLCIDGSAGS